MKNNKIKSAVATFAIGASALLDSNAYSADLTPHGRAEVVIGDNVSQLEFKASSKLTDNLNIFVKSVTTHDYKTGNTSPFAFIDINYKLGNGISATYETQFIDLKDGTLIQPRLGLSYFKSLAKDLALSASATVNFPQERDLNWNEETVIALRYTPKLSEKSEYYALGQLETLTNVGEKGINFASQKLRLGLGKGHVEAGIAINFKETPNSQNHTIGGFVAYKF